MLDKTQLPALHHHVVECLAEAGFRPKLLSPTAIGLYVEGMYHRVMFDEDDPEFVVIMCSAFRTIAADEDHAVVLAAANEVNLTIKGVTVFMQDRPQVLSASSEFLVSAIDGVTTDCLLRRLRMISRGMGHCRGMLDNSTNWVGDDQDQDDQIDGSVDLHDAGVAPLCH